jgi:exonuclease SbcC
MKLKNLTLHRLPGFKRSFEIADIRSGLNIIVGPNASGKTSICQAVRRLLWPHQVKHFLSACIHSQWIHNEDTFTVEVKDGNLTPDVSQAGKSLLARLPQEHLMSCFSMTIDELFDGKDQEFVQRISREIAGGYDLEAAQKQLDPPVATRTAFKEWEEAEARFEQYRRVQDSLRQEGGELPDLERAIKEAEGGNFNVSALEKIIKLKIVKNKIAACENDLNQFPQQLVLAKVRATDWENYEHLVKERDSLREKIVAQQSAQKALERSVGKWRRILLPEGELDRQMDCIQAIQRLESKKNEIESEIDKLESDLKEHLRLLGISSVEEIEKIQAEQLDDLEEEWKNLEQLSSKIAGIEAQIRLNDGSKDISSEALGQTAQLLIELASNPHVKSTGFWIVTGITFALAGVLLFFLTSWMRLCALSLLIPLGFLWLETFRKAERHRQLKHRYSQSGLPPLTEWNAPAIFQQLNQTVMQWGSARQIDSQLQRKREMQSSLEPEIHQQQGLRQALIKRAQSAGISILPSTRYRFANYLKNLHRDWIQLKKARIELKGVSDSLTNAWKQWYIFADLFEDKRCADGYEGVKIHARIKDRINDIAILGQIESQLDKERKIEEELEHKMTQLLTRTKCSENPDSLQKLVEQLNDYQQLQSDLKSLKSQLDELSFELGDLRAARIQENFETLEGEKRTEEEKARALKELSEKNGSLKARIKQMEAATEGNELLRDQNQKFEMLRLACRDFAKKELMGFLVSEAQKDFQRDCQPPVLEKAVEWFRRFTKNKFRLEAPLTPTGSIAYEAIETTTAERRTLDQLSRGTRMQLLMSVRLAFAFHSEEKDLPLPIFLDEVLANTDPERFDSIAEVVGELIASGRQIFYLTCNPEDARKWQQRCPDAHIIDLAQVHGQQAFLAAPLPDSIESFQIPKPSTQNLDAYAKELKLTAFRIDEPLEMASIHYLVDSVDDLHRLLQSGIATYGNLLHWLHLIEKGFPNTAALINRRRHLLERFFDLGTRGRGKALSRDALLDGGLSKTFIEAIWELAQELDCNAKQLIEFLEDKNKKDDRKKGLRAEGRENLKEYLSAHGYLDERAVLSKDEIRCELLPLTIEEQDRLFVEKLLTHTIPNVIQE